ncbi:MAG: putative peptide zinc metalloprotease protein [Dinoroseobacter sp.]|jgi:putative peptide zinc metalloprotease protein
MAKAQNRSARAVVRLGVFLAAVTAVVTLIPLPFSAKGSGQVLPVAEEQVVVGTTGRVAEVLVGDGAILQAGEAVMTLESPEIVARLSSLDISVAFLTEALERAGLPPNVRQRIERELSVAIGVRDDVTERVDALSVRTIRAGQLVWAGGSAPLPGAFMARGQVMGHVIGPGALELVMALPAAYSGLVQDGEGATSVNLLLPDGTRLSRRLARERVVDVGGQVPQQLLVSAGGPVPEQPGGQGRALDTVWLGWAALGENLESRAGMRFDVRVNFGSASIAEQGLFHLRRLFLRVIRI